MRPRPRLYVSDGLSAGVEVTLAAQAHYLVGVMRLSPGDTVALFNGRDGEWRACIETATKKRVILRCKEQTAPQRRQPDLWLVFAPIKKTRTDFIVEKAAELGAARIQPVITQHTNAERVRIERLQAHAIEAAEQCGETCVAQVVPPLPLPRLLETWPSGRQLVFCDENPDAAKASMASVPTGPAAILIGPEGGFSDAEAAAIRAVPQAHAIHLGPRILRADTAAVAALTLWQSSRGDWQ